MRHRRLRSCACPRFSFTGITMNCRATEFGFRAALPTPRLRQLGQRTSSRTVRFPGYAAVTWFAEKDRRASRDATSDHMDTVAASPMLSFRGTALSHEAYRTSLSREAGKKDSLLSWWASLKAVSVFATPTSFCLTAIHLLPAATSAHSMNAKSIPIAEAIQRPFRRQWTISTPGAISRLTFSS